MFGIALKEKECSNGLTRSEVMDLFDMLDSTEAYPLEIASEFQGSVAMGFITVEASESLYYDYRQSGLLDFITGILDDMNEENESCQYEFKGIKIWLSR